MAKTDRQTNRLTDQQIYQKTDIGVHWDITLPKRPDICK